MIKSLRRITASNTMTQKLAAALATVILVAAPVAGHAALVGIGFGGSVYSINETTGAGTLLGSSGFGDMNSMARNSAGILYSATHSSLITINPVTGAGTLASTLSGFGAEGIDIRGLAFSSTGVLYAVNDGGSLANDLLYTINASTGAMTLVGTMAFVGVLSLTFSSGGTLYGFDGGGALRFVGDELGPADVAAHHAGNLVANFFAVHDELGAVAHHLVHFGVEMAERHDGVRDVVVRGCCVAYAAGCADLTSHAEHDGNGDAAHLLGRVAGRGCRGPAPSVVCGRAECRPHAAVAGLALPERRGAQLYLGHNATALYRID